MPTVNGHTKIPELTPWDAEQRTWTVAKRELVTICQNYDMDCIVDAAQSIADHIQAQYDPLRTAVSAGATKPKIKTRIAEFKDEELEKMMTRANNGDVVRRITILKLSYLGRELSKDWNQPRTFGLENSDEGKAALKQIHAIAQSKQLRMINQNFIIMLQNAWIKPKGNNRQQERLRGILYSRRVQDLLDGSGMDLSKWPTQPWLWVAVEVLSRILLLYEGVAEAVDGNFIADVARLLKQTNDPSVLSVHEADQNMERLLLPLKQNFTTLVDFLNYMRACVQAEIIARMATLDSPEGKAWEKAHNKLIELRQESSTLTLEMVLQVVKLAENHLARIESRSTLDAEGFTASATTPSSAASSASTGMEQQLAMQASTITDLEKKLSEYAARSAGTQRGDSGPPRDRKRRAGERGRNQKGTARFGQGAREPAPQKSGPGARQSDTKTSAVTCPTCGKLHRGKCVMDRDLDREQAELDRSRKLKSAIGRNISLEASYVHSVRQLESEVSNEEDSNYFDPGYGTPSIQALSTRAATAPAGNVYLVQRDPCVDSGSPVDITGHLPWTEETGGTAKLSGVTGNAQICKRVKISYPILTETGRAITVRTNGPGLYMTPMSDNILSLALLMQAGHQVNFKVGTEQDPGDGGTIHLADGDSIRLRFDKGVWRLPLVPTDGTVSDIPPHLDVACNMKVSVLPVELTPSEEAQVYHNAWGHPSNSTFEKIVRHRHGKGFPRHLLRTLRHLKCKICGICKGARNYRQTKRMREKVERNRARKRSTGATRPAAETESDSEPEPPPGPSSSHPPDAPAVDKPSGVAHLDTAYGIKMGIHKEKYYLLFVLGDTDFTWAVPTTSRASPERHLQTFLAQTRATIKSIRVDGEFARRHGLGQGDSLFEAYCRSQNITISPAAASNHTSQARAESAVRVTKEHMRCLMKTANAPPRFWPWALQHFCRIYNHWNVAGRLPPWTRQRGHEFNQDIERDIQVWGCYCTGFLPREHPLVVDGTNDDRRVEGVFLGWDLSSPTVWIWSLKYKKELRMADPQFFSHLFPFSDPTCIVNTRDLDDAEVVRMHSEDAAHEVEDSDDDVAYPPARAPSQPSATQQSQLPTPHQPAPAHEQTSKRELRPRTTPPIPPPQQPQPQDLPTSRRRHPPAHQDTLDQTQIVAASDKRIATALIHNKVLLHVPATWWIHPDTGKHCACTVLPIKTYNENKVTYLDAEILAPHDLAERTELKLPVTKGQYNVRDLLNLNFDYPATLQDLGINGRSRALAVAVQHWSAYGGWADPDPPTTRHLHAYTTPRARTEHEWRDDLTSGPFEDPADNLIWCGRSLATDGGYDYLSSVDVLEPDPKSHRQAMKHPRLKPFWEGAETLEMDGLWARGCLRRIRKSELTDTERKHIFRSKFHYKIKRSGRTGKVTKCKARVVVMGNTMTQGDDYFDAFAPVPRATAGRLVMALSAGGRRHIHSLDITQAFIQSEWQYLPEGVPSRIFVIPPDGVEEAPGVVYEILKPLYGIPNSARALHFTLDNFMKSQGFVAAGFEDSVWVCESCAKYKSKIIVSAHIDDLLVSCEDLRVLTAFKRAFLARFDGTDDGELQEYLGCEVVRSPVGDITLRQSAYAERILRTYGAWDFHAVKTPLEPGKRLTKKDSPEFVDPMLHRQYRGFVGHLSFLVQMTRPDLAFAFSELSKFVQAPGLQHWKSVLRTLQYLRGTYNQGITYSDPGADRRDRLEGWVDSDFAADPDTRRSVTGYVLSINNGPISWKSKRQSCTTLSSAEAEFVAASICGQELIYVRSLLAGLGFQQIGPTVIWEDNAACIAMSENPTHADRARHIDTRIYFLRDMVRDGIVKLKKVPGQNNVSDALTKSLPAPAFEKHREYLWGSGVPFSAFWATLPDWQHVASFKITIEAWEVMKLVVETMSLS